MDYLPGLIVPAVIAAIIGYLFGSVSFSIIITKIVKNREDIRKYGSGNAGMTNVIRSVGRLPGALTFLFDFLKCVAAITVGYFIFSYVCADIGAPQILTQIGKYAAGIGCVIGHIFPLYFGFKGGKGVVTTAALIILLDWRVFIPAFLTFLIIFAVKRIVSLGSIIGVSLYPVYTFLIMVLFDYQNSPLPNHGQAAMPYILLITLASAVIGSIVVIVHRPNIKRLLRGEEKPLSLKKEN